MQITCVLNDISCSMAIEGQLMLLRHNLLVHHCIYGTVGTVPVTDSISHTYSFSFSYSGETPNRAPPSRTYCELSGSSVFISTIFHIASAKIALLLYLLIPGDSNKAGGKLHISYIKRNGSSPHLSPAVISLWNSNWESTCTRSSPICTDVFLASVMA